jgi:hypothetical protein
MRNEYIKQTIYKFGSQIYRKAKSADPIAAILASWSLNFEIEIDYFYLLIC